MRGTVTGLATPYPLRTMLPAVLREDDFLERWTAGLDDVLAPVVSTLDCLAAYLDPATAPTDFLAWLAGWFGVVLDENLPLERRRASVAGAVRLYRARGTLAGLRAQLELCPAAASRSPTAAGSWPRGHRTRRCPAATCRCSSSAWHCRRTGRPSVNGRCTS